jgi:D-alanyl-D-alanine carboxypeptidase/D-alanyl-D-alanine-endopeptidase (penicillin-binding protein 4)
MIDKPLFLLHFMKLEMKKTALLTCVALLQACSSNSSNDTNAHNNVIEPTQVLSSNSSDQQRRKLSTKQLRDDVLAANKNNIHVSMFLSNIDAHTAAAHDGKSLHENDVIAVNEHQLMNPASTMKLVTTSSALGLLDLTYQSQTSIWIEPQKHTETPDVLQGPVYLKGQASAAFDRGQLLQLLEQLWLRGYRHLPEGVVFDRAFFQPLREDLTAPAFDETPLALYNLIPDSLLFDEGIQRILLRSDERSLRIALAPVLHNVDIDTSHVMIKGKCGQWRYPGQLTWQWVSFNRSTASSDAKVAELSTRGQTTKPSPYARLIVRGHFPANCQQHVFAPWFDRDDQLALIIAQSWQQLGGTFGLGKSTTAPISRSAAVPSNAIQIAALPSIALTEWIRRINKYSDNPLARSLFMTLGQSCLSKKARNDALDDSTSDELATSTSQSASTPSSKQCATAQIFEYLSAKGIDPSGIVLENGSGLSRQERISAKQLADIIVMAYQQPTSAEFVSSLPIAGKDGTMQRRLSQPCLAGRLRLKTGSLRNVTSIAGLYLPPTGSPHVLVIMINGSMSNNNARQLIDQWLWQYLAPMTPECNNAK